MPILKYLPVALLLLTLTACGGTDTDADTTPMTHDDAMQADATQNVEARMEDGVQVVEIEASMMGFAPKQITLQAGVPARLVFTRTVEGACSEQIQVPAFDVEKTELPLNEPVMIEFTPEETGEFTFVCGMNMQEGTIVVEA